MKRLAIFVVVCALVGYGIVFAASKVSVVAQTGEFVDVLNNANDYATYEQGILADQAVLVNDGSRLYSVWNGATNSLYIVSPDGAYTNLIMTTAGE